VAEIVVQRGDVERSMSTFHVTVRDDDSSTEHDVTLSANDFDRLGRMHRTPEEFVRACFEFLLQREPKESILPRFDVSVISTYFPEFETKVQGPDTR
jgi:predicted nucleotidyltransferase